MFLPADGRYHESIQNSRTCAWNFVTFGRMDCLTIEGRREAVTEEQLYEESYPIVYGYLLSLCGSASMAEDLTSETFLRAIENIHRFDGTCRPSTWLCAIGRNLYLNERKRFLRHVSLEHAGEIAAPGFEESILDRFQAEQIGQAVKKLDETRRQVFLMRVSGLSFREIGDAMGKTENWARVTFFRTKTKVLQEVEG